jgi:hypothetical protein
MRSGDATGGRYLGVFPERERLAEGRLRADT